MEESFGKVLLIDDDPNIIKLYSDPLTNAHYQVDSASNGTDGLAKILQGGYDFILLDIMLPDIDGIAILKRLKETSKDDDNHYSGPIIIMSQLEEPQIIDSAMQNGAKGYLVKGSFAPDQIVNKVSEILTTSAQESASES